ncbi:hypothetical protein EYF80_045191 [Liparis tanakae]|uniref:Uncharacterized protein n=1 Tax=Liparis tanakae TaxID=230148 RepID=A0A4Z2FUC4_9TELE|nr:hypothetical protein EYF80_045191 [Liparis tanakae]
MRSSATGVHLTDDRNNLKRNRVFPLKSEARLTHGQQPLRANLRGEVGEALGQVTGPSDGRQDATGPLCWNWTPVVASGVMSGRHVFPLGDAPFLPNRR